jgi:ubiquinone biosynthesis protein COQ9
MSMKEKILFAALSEIPFSGVSDETLAKAAKEAGANAAELRTEFPSGPASLAEEFSHWADAQMIARMNDARPERLRDRIALSVRARIEVLAPHKEAARRMAAFLALPQNAPLGAKLLFASVDAMWRAAGDTSSDFSYYTKRGTLAGVYGTTLLFWFADESENSEATWAFLSGRIEDVMRFENFKGEIRKGIADLPDPFSILTNLRPR